MFIYAGKITGVLLPRPGSPYRRYSVFIPNVTSTFVEAFALDVPGITSLYQYDDTVMVADVEADDFDFLILGRLQLQVPDERRVLSLSADQAVLRGGKISNEVTIQNSAQAANSTEVDDSVIPKEESLKSIQADMHSLETSLGALSVLFNQFKGATTP